MSVEEIKAIVRRFVDEPWNKGNLNTIDELCDPAYTVGKLAGESYGGREGLKKAVADSPAGKPGFHAAMDEIIVEGDRVAYVWTMRYTGGDEVETHRGITILHFANGKIVQDRFLSVLVKE